MLVILLAENARIPVDDPNTHLELTMIHEVMVLDHSGPDFAFILYSAALKLWVMGALLIGFALPVRTGNLLIDIPIAVAGMILLAALIGVIESIMARLRLLHVPQLLVWAGVIAVIGLILVLR
jgi:formate hydrogenlyase subunit 4